MIFDSAKGSIVLQQSKVVLANFHEFLGSMFQELIDRMLPRVRQSVRKIDKFRRHIVGFMSEE